MCALVGVVGATEACVERRSRAFPHNLARHSHTPRSPSCLPNTCVLKHIFSKVQDDPLPSSSYTQSPDACDDARVPIV